MDLEETIHPVQLHAVSSNSSEIDHFVSIIQPKLPLVLVTGKGVEFLEEY